MMDTPKIGETVRLNIWRNLEGGTSGGPWGLLPDWKEWACPEHTGPHRVVDVRSQADSQHAFLGAPFADPLVEVACVPGSECDPQITSTFLGAITTYVVPIAAVRPS